MGPSRSRCERRLAVWLLIPMQIRKTDPIDDRIPDPFPTVRRIHREPVAVPSDLNQPVQRFLLASLSRR
jgi:hypothetical protein